MEDEKNKKSILKTDVGKFFSKEFFMVLLFIIAFLVIYSIKITVKSFWLDEGVVLSIASAKSLSLVIQAIIKTSENHPPLYFFIIHYLIKLFGITHLLRISSVLAALGCAWASYLLSFKLFDKKTAVATGILFLIFSFFIRYSQELRMYPLLAMLWYLSFYFTLKIIDENKKINFIILGLINLIALYLHYFSIFMIAGQMLIFAIKYSEAKDKIKGYIIALVSAVILYIPWMPQIFHEFRLKAAPVGGSMPFPVDFIDLIAYLSFGDLTDAILPSFPWLIKIIGIIFLGFIIYFFFLNKSKERLLIGVMLILPVAAELVVGIFNPYFIAYKHFYLLIPVLAMIYGYIITKAPTKVFSAILIILLLAGNIFSFYNYNFAKDNYYGGEDWEMVGSQLSFIVQPDELVIINPSMFYTAFGLYYHGRAPLALVDTPYDLNAVLNKYLSPDNPVKVRRIFLVQVPYYPVSALTQADEEIQKRFKPSKVIETRKFYPRWIIRITIYDLQRQ